MSFQAHAETGREFYATKNVTWHLTQLDALRGLAVLGVICIHAAQCVLSPVIGNLFIAGQRGVQLFFVVSAFTLFLSAENRSKERHPTLNFFIRRYFRLAPMYYVALAASQVFSTVTRGSKGDLILASLFLHGLRERTIVKGAFGGWSMADEALFYLCFPFLFRTIRNLKSALIALMIVVPPTVLLSRYLAGDNPAHWGFYLFTWFPAEFPVFLMGIAAFFFWKEHIRGAALHDAKLISAGLLMIVVAFYFDSIPVSDWKLVASSAACPVLLLSVLIHPWRFLVNRVTIYFGKISYSMYLVHLFLIWVVIPRLAFRYGIPWQTPPHLTIKMLALVVYLTLITVAISHLTWRFIEVPGIRVGKWLISRWESKKPSLAAFTGPVAETPEAQF